jgi:Uma2 family endonuclease
MHLPAAVRRHRFTVEAYFRMGEAGILSEDDRVELIEGEIVEMSPIGNRHSAAVSRLIRLFSGIVGERAIVRAQDPFLLSEVSAPQPDIALVRYRVDFYETAHPQAKDVLLLVEVAESSSRYDLRVKAQLYARARIPEYWVVDLTRNRITVHTDPDLAGYRSVRTLSQAAMFSSPAFPTATWSVADILGSPA